MRQIIKLILLAAMLMNAQQYAALARGYATDSMDSHPTGYVIVGGGAGIATGMFHSTNWNVYGTHSGFANTGFAAWRSLLCL